MGICTRDPEQPSVSEPQSDNYSGRPWILGMLWVLPLAGLAYLVGLTLWLSLIGLTFPYQLDYGEGFLLHFVRSWSQGQPIYKAAEGYPYIVANYPPLSILLALALTPLLGLTYAAGRIWTLLAISALAAIIGAWVKQEGGRWLPAVIVSLAFVGSPYVYHWAPLFRVDLVGLALTLGGLYAVWRGARSGRPAWIWSAAVLFVAALFTKQSFLFAPAAAFLFLFLCVDRWWAIRMGLAIAVLGGGLFLLVNTLTGGGFWFGLVSSNVNPFLWPEFWKQQADFFGTFALLALLAAWYLFDKFVLDRRAPLAAGASVRDRVTPLDFYLPAALASLWFAGKAGAWENYFFEALAALALCAGLGLARWERRVPRTYVWLAPLLVLAQVLLMWHTPRAADRFLRLTRVSNEEIAPLLAATPDPIVSEDMGLLVTNDKVLDYCSFQYSQLARAGRWDQSWELGQLQDRAFSLVILEQGTRLDVDRYQRFTREFLSELDRNYRHTRTAGKYHIYEPDPLERERRVDFGDQLRIVGWSLDAPPDLKPGDSFAFTVVWQAQQALDTDYTAFAHLVDSTGRGWSGDDHAPYDGLYPTSRWGPGEMMRDRFVLSLPAEAPEGLYDLLVGWYPSNLAGAGEPGTGQRLPVGEGNALRIAVLPVGRDTAGTHALQPSQALFGQAIRLEGYDWQTTPGALQLALRWSAEDDIDIDYTVFVHLVAAATGQEPLAQGDGPPLEGRWPTSLWLPGVPVDDFRPVSLPSDLPAGTYDLLVGLYDPGTNHRLSLVDGSDALRITGVYLP
jgi:hypothetical protein